MITRALTSPLLAALATLPVLTVATGAPASADSQTDVVTPTGWWWMSNVSLTAVQDRINLGYRLVDIEVEDDSPLRFSAAFVRNVGDYAKSWWWYYGQTANQVTARLAQHGARLIDVEPYETPNGIRYAIVLIQNAGTDFAPAHGWESGLTSTQLQDWINDPVGRRIIDIQPYEDGGSRRYAFCWVENSGFNASGWWAYHNVSSSFISGRLSANNARLIDLEPHDGSSRFSCVMVPIDGNAWWWFHNMQLDDVDRLANQYASRIIDFQRYRTSGGSTRYAMVLRRNDNDLAVGTTIAMREGLPFDATSGFVLREYNGATSTMAGVFEDRIFEPASLMKTMHNFIACGQVAIGVDTFATLMLENQGLNGSCPTGSNPAIRPLRDVLEDMMQISSNTATEAIRARYGTAFIEATVAAFGATNVDLNHTIGCLCSGTRNEVTLMDFADVHEAVVAGSLGPVRQDFYDIMQNGFGFGMGASSTVNVLNQELAASSLSATEQDAFRNGMLLAHKGGSYTCISGPDREEHRSRGAYVRLPHRSGCNTVMMEYFIGAWVNDAETEVSAEDAVGLGITSLYRDRVRAAIDTWESATCSPWSNYGVAVPNSTGVPGRCWATGSSFLVSNDLTILARSLPLNSFGFLLVGDERVFVANPGGSAGNLLVGGRIGRYQNMIMSTGTTGQLSLTIDSTAIPNSAGPPVQLVPGDRLYFTWWHRDTDPATSAPTSNFTDGLRVTFI
ncbi:MAG: serine hydrolase [Planctomycetota bacterium]